MALLKSVSEILSSVPNPEDETARDILSDTGERGEGSVPISSGVPSLPQPGPHRSTQIPPSAFGSTASKALIKLNRRRGDKEQHKEIPSAIAHRPPPLVKERITSMVDPAHSYFAKWERMKDKRDARELAVIRRHVRHELIRDVSLAAFLEEKANLNRSLRRMHDEVMLSRNCDIKKVSNESWRRYRTSPRPGKAW